LGLVRIRNRPIHWINVIHHIEPAGEGAVTHSYLNLYLVPASHVPYVEIDISDYPVVAMSRIVKDKPIFGNISGIRWEGRLKDSLIPKLTDDSSIFAAMFIEVFIRSFPAYKCWEIDRGSSPVFCGPLKEEWDCYERMAEHLLEHSKNYPHCIC
jgi:hypothetical protein